MALRVRVAAFVSIAAVALAASGCLPSRASSGGGSLADGQTLMETKCTMCHSLDRINGAIYDAKEWEATISRMQVNGLVVTVEEKQAIVAYLAARDATR